MTEKMIEEIRKKPLSEHYELIKKTSQSLCQAHKQYLVACQKVRDHNGPYTGKGRGSSLFALMEKKGKVVRDLEEQLRVLVNLL